MNRLEREKKMREGKKQQHRDRTERKASNQKNLFGDS